MYREGNSSTCIHASTDQLLGSSSRDPSGSNIMIPSMDARALALTAAQDLELNVSTVAVEESSSTEYISNSTQQVVGSTL